ncbi:MAG: LysM peptidoglycan-binding domain-containing protein [Nitrospirota bacterium]|nr:LysM peptidoglycan-binding domain-containing protein [Nitrospirota bacterium]
MRLRSFKGFLLLVCGLILPLLFAARPARAAEVGITDIRSWSGPDSTRVVADLTGEADYQVTRSADGAELVISIRASHAITSGRSWGPVDKRVGQISLEEGSGASVVRVSLTGPAFYKHFSLAPYGSQKPHRIVVDVLPAPARAGASEMAPTATPVSLPPLSPPPGRGPFLVMVDAGHGGEDPGAIGRYFRTSEKRVVLSIARKLKAELDAIPGIRAQMTRDGDYFVPLADRIRMADEAGADLFVSIHADSSHSRRTRGTHVYTLSPRSSEDRQAIRVAQMENASDYIGGAEAAVRLPIVFDGNGAPNSTLESRVLGALALERLRPVNSNGREGRRGQARFWVLKGNRPSILVETGFLSNKKDERQLRDARFQSHLARNLALAIRDYQESRSGGVPVRHVVRRGENLGLIARRYRVGVDEIIAANRLRNPSRLAVGQTLDIPGRRTTPPTVGRRPDLLAAASVSPPATTPAPAPAPTPVAADRPVEAVAAPPSVPAPPTPVAVRRHVVTRGEYLVAIARNYGVTLEALVRANQLDPGRALWVGQALVIPAAASADALVASLDGGTVSDVPSDTRSGASTETASDPPADPADPAGRMPLVDKWKAMSREMHAGEGAAASAPEAAPEPGIRPYTVVRGDSLSRVAERFGMRVADLARLNGLSVRARLETGRGLKVVDNGGGAERLHVVRRGDSLMGIARLYAVAPDSIRDRNAIDNADHLPVGARLLIPN